jgi:hypothetical protein
MLLLKLFQIFQNPKTAEFYIYVNSLKIVNFQCCCNKFYIFLEKKVQIHQNLQNAFVTFTIGLFFFFLNFRILLEKAAVRSAAVSTLAKFASKVPDLQNSIIVILKRTLNDSDDDVRDRALFCLNTLKNNEKKIEIVSQSL